MLVALIAALTGCDTAEKQASRKAREQAEARRFTKLVEETMCGNRRSYALSSLIEESEQRGGESYGDFAFDIASDIEKKGCPAGATK